MLLEVRLRVDLFGNHYIEFDNKVSIKVNVRDYEDVSYIIIKKENEKKLKIKE